jgi:hypothetical protein
MIIFEDNVCIADCCIKRMCCDLDVRNVLSNCFMEVGIVTLTRCRVGADIDTASALSELSENGRIEVRAFP